MAKIDCSKLRTPTAELIEAACKQFDDQNAVTEQTLKDLFSQYRCNCDLHRVFLKVVALNFLYSTHIVLYSTKIPDLEDVARHIHHNSQDIDSALDAQPPEIEIVDRINSVIVPGKKGRGCFSFATKYCSLHRPESYPIWDSNVETYLSCLQKRTGFAKDFRLNADWKYPAFHRVMSAFRQCYGLGSFTFKEIDKFLWLEGERLKNSGAQI